MEMNRTEELKEYLRKIGDKGIALAFSGGVDSSLLLSVLKELREESSFPLTALTMQTVFQQDDELAEARRTADECGVELRIFHCNPLSLPEIRSNPPDRCYWCKRHIFSQFLVFMQNHGLSILMDGTNADDLHVYRPGRKALRELGVISPLAELGFSKAEIRALAAARGLRCSTRPSRPCLATRFEYGTKLTPELLEKTGKGEEMIRKLVPPDTDVRLRVHGSIARIEVSQEAVEPLMLHRKKLSAGLRQLGFEFITLDLEGFRSGCYDKKEEGTL